MECESGRLTKILLDCWAGVKNNSRLGPAEEYSATSEILVAGWRQLSVVDRHSSDP